MSMMFLSTTDYHTGEITEFNIEAARDVNNKDLKAIHDELVFMENLSFGKIFKQNDSGNHWYINPNHTIARLIDLNQLDLLHKWDNEVLLPSDQQFEKLEKIGGLPSSPYSFYPADLQFPAKITTNSGKEIDLCIIHFSQAPPFQRHFKKVLLLSDINYIQSSELALSHELRLKSTLADEIRMSFYPFMTRTNTGMLITYNGTTQFASTGDIKGNEILSEVNFSYDHFDQIKDVPVDNLTYIIGKWDSRLENLFNEYRQRLK